MFNINKNERKETMSQVEKRTLPVETCVARNRQNLRGKKVYSQVEGYMTVDYINDEPVAFSLCPSRKIPKGFDGYYTLQKECTYNILNKSKHIHADNLPKKAFLKKLSEARAIDSDRVRSDWVEVL